MVITLLFCLFAVSCVDPAVRVSHVVSTSQAPPAPSATSNAAEVSRVTNDATSDLAPRPSPDGKSILFTAADSHVLEDPNEPKPAGVHYSVIQIDLAGVGRKLVAGPYACEPTWIPKSDGLVYVYLRLKKQQIVRTSVTGVGMTFITQSALGDQDENPDVSPDGKHVAFMTPIGSQMMICTVGIDGTNYTTYVEGYMPHWNPDGTAIVFHTKAGNVSLLNLAKGQVTQLTNSTGLNVHASWSPDGKWIVFASTRDGRSHIYIMHSDGSSVTQLTQGQARESLPAWSSDGYIYFSSDAGGVAASTEDPWNWSQANIWRLRPVAADVAAQPSDK